MNKWLSSIVLVVFSATAVFVSAGEKSNKVQKEKKDRLLTLYKDKARFEKLSGTAKMRLQRKFRGKRQKVASGTGTPIVRHENRSLSPADVLPNVLVNDPTLDSTIQDTQSTTSIVLAGPNIVVAYTDSGSLIPPTAEHFTGYSHSTNGGTSFADDGGLPNDPGGEGDDGDPVLARNNTTGRVYLATGSFDTGEVLLVFRSDDNGLTFAAPVHVGFTGIGDIQDKQWIDVDNFPGTGQGNVYMGWRSFGDGIYFSRSTDHGATWSTAAQVADEGTGNVQGANVVVGNDHSVHVFWLDQSSGNGTTNIIKTRKSTDQGVTFGTPVDVATLTTTGTNGDLSLSSGFLTNSFPHAAVNPVLGDIYVTWNDDVSGADSSDVFATLSTDGGATWATPTNITDIFDSSTNDDFTPTLTVTPDGTKAFFAWYDRELDPNNNLLIDRFGAIANATSGLLSFTSQFRISDESFPPAFSQDPQMEIRYMGDYDQAVADNSFFYTAWGDNRLGNLQHKNQPDVRFAKIPVAGPGGILVSLSNAIDDSNGNNNGMVDFNECVDLTLTLKNLGTATVTGISTTLTSSTTDVTVVSGTSNYPDLAPAASATNSTTFRFQTASTFACGTNINFSLAVTTANAGTYLFTFAVQSGADGTSSQFDNNTITPLPDATPTGPTTTDIPFPVSGFTGNIGKVTLSMYLTHTYDGDLDISLIAPNGTEVALSDNNGGDGEDFGSSCSPESSRTTFDDAAATFIEDGTPPYVGTFRPEESLSDFNGLNGTDVNGVWTLRIKDEALIDVGTFNCASLFLTAAICTDGGGTACLAACIYENTFNGPLDFIEEKPTVTQTGGFLVLTPAGKKAIAHSPPAFGGCQNCTITAELKFSGGDGAKGWMYTHRVDKNTQIEVLFKVEQGRIVIKQRVNGNIVKKGKANFTLAADTLYSTKLQYNGTIVTLTIDGAPVLTFTPVGTIQSGIVAFGSKLNITSVDHLCVQ